MRSTAAPRGVIGGAVLLAVGAAFLLPPLGVPNAGAYLFVALGLAFAVAWWLGSKQFVYLVPAGVLIGFGLGLVLPTLFDLPADAAGPVFLGTLALGLFVVFLWHPHGVFCPRSRPFSRSSPSPISFSTWSLSRRTRSPTSSR